MAIRCDKIVSVMNIFPAPSGSSFDAIIGSSVFRRATFSTHELDHEPHAPNAGTRKKLLLSNSLKGTTVLITIRSYASLYWSKKPHQRLRCVDSQLAKRRRHTDSQISHCIASRRWCSEFRARLEVNLRHNFPRALHND
jgi:hypothetical protein